MRLQQFNGGRSSRLEPQLIQANEGTRYVNIDIASGVLRPVRDKIDSGINVSKYAKFFTAGDVWVSSTLSTDYLEYQSVMYSTDRLNRPKKRNSSGAENFLGIEGPTTAPILTALDVAKPLEEITVENVTGAGNLPVSDFSYLLFNVNSEGVYSEPTEVVAEIKPTFSATVRPVTVLGLEAKTRYSSKAAIEVSADRTINFSALKGEFASSAVLYRRYKGEYYLVGTFSTELDTVVDSVEDISGNAILDLGSISGFGGVYQYLYTYYNSADGTESKPSPLSEELDLHSGSISVSSIAVSNDPQVDSIRLYRIGNNIAQFTLVTTLDRGVTSYRDVLLDTDLDGRLLGSDNYHEAPVGLKYLTEAYAMLFGVVGDTLRFTPVGVPNAWPPEFSIKFNDNLTGIAAVANGLLVYTKIKTFLVTGTGPTTLSQQPLSGEQGCIAFESIQSIGASAIWAAEDGLYISSGNEATNVTERFIGEVTLEPTASAVRNKVYYCLNKDRTILSFDYRGEYKITNYALGVDTLVTSGKYIYGWLNGVFYILFGSTTAYTELSFTSARFIEGEYTDIKNYKKFHFYTEGNITIKILLDGLEAGVYSYTDTGTKQTQVPVEKQRANSVQFEVSGTGVVHEIKYVPTLTNND